MSVKLIDVIGIMLFTFIISMGSLTIGHLYSIPPDGYLCHHENLQ